METQREGGTGSREKAETQEGIKVHTHARRNPMPRQKKRSHKGGEEKERKGKERKVYSAHAFLSIHTQFTNREDRKVGVPPRARLLSQPSTLY